MPTEMKLWEVINEKPLSVEKSKLDLEERLEKWLEEDISIISSNLLVIGSQVTTAYGGYIDLLAIDSDANLVVLELKRHKTPRDIVAQTLDYASWIEDLSLTEIEGIADSYLDGESLEDAFQNNFKNDLPDVVNERHRMYIVASEIDSSTDRIVQYLSKQYGVDINVATFSFFKQGEQEFVGKSFLLDETEVTIRAETGSKRKPNLSWEELENIAKEHGVFDLYNMALSKFQSLFNSVGRTRTSVSFAGDMVEKEKKRKYNILNIIPGATEDGLNLLGVSVHLSRLCGYFGLEESEVKEILGEKDSRVKWSGHPVYGFDKGKLERFIELLRK